MALFPSPDLSTHVVTVPGNVLFPAGSAPSSQRIGLPRNAAVPDTAGTPNDGTVLAELADPDTVAISRVPFCANDEMVNGMAAVTDENGVDGRDILGPPDDAVTVSVYVVPMVAEMFALVTPVTVPNCDPSAFLRMN